MTKFHGAPGSVTKGIINDRLPGYRLVPTLLLHELNWLIVENAEILPCQHSLLVAVRKNLAILQQYNSKNFWWDLMDMVGNENQRPPIDHQLAHGLKVLERGSQIEPRGWFIEQQTQRVVH